MAKTLSDALGAEGVEVDFFHAQNRELTSTGIGLRRPMSREINAFLARLGGSTWVVDFGLADALIERAATSDVLHVHNLHGYYLNFRRLFEGLRNLPVVWTWHDMWGATGRCGFSFDCERWQIGCGSCPNKSSYPGAWLDNSSREYSKKSQLYEQLSNLHVVCPSRWLCDIALQRGFAKDRVHCVPNPIDTDTYRPSGKKEARKQLGLNLEETYLLFVAADVRDPRKGFTDFSRLVETDGWKGLVVGKPPTDQGNDMVYMGSIRDANQMALCYSAADAFVITSKADNFPNTVLEAYSCGTPVFGYAVGGVANQMLGPCEAFLAGSGDVLRLTELLRAYLAGVDASRAASIREAATARWSPAAVARQYIDIYDLALGQ